MNDLRINNLNQSNGLFTKNKTYYSISGSTGPYLIFIHGVGLNGEIWGPQIEYFSQNHRVVTYDFLGHGLSEAPSKTPKLEDYVEQLNELVQSINISSFALIGHSMGALISVAYSLKYPKNINAIISLNIVYKRSIKARNEVIKRANTILKTREIGNIDETLERWFKNKTDINQMEKINKVRKFLSNASPKGYGEAYKLFAKSDSIFENKLNELKPPTLYLTGSDDPNSTSKMSKEMANESPKGVSKSIDNEAHMMAYIAPEKVNPIIEDFLITNEQS
ncbi:MAG: alpha/beta hydrolase [Pseudomonadota bacterium]|nr:alpha/beta hydrolase [Pseudomonadota bacterium]